jgi:hypothetical protein
MLKENLNDSEIYEEKQAMQEKKLQAFYKTREQEAFTCLKQQE